MPSEAFRRAAARQRRLVIADGALTNADRITPVRIPFANLAAAALADYAAAPGSARAGLKQFFAERGVNFAASAAAVTVTYRIHRPNAPTVTKTSQWHLIDGSATTADNAARVYFNNIGDVIVVARCGPHPAGDFEVSVHLE